MAEKLRIRSVGFGLPTTGAGEIPDWLEREGYEVVAAKQRLPLWIQVGENQYESRLYADYVALEGEEAYVVILAKAKKTLRLSGAAIRDRSWDMYSPFKPPVSYMLTPFREP